MRVLCCLAASLVALVASGQEGKDTKKHLQPSSLMHWLRIVELEDNRLVYAVETDDDYFAISLDKDCDLLVARYGKSKAPENAKRRVIVTDAKTGDSVADYSRDKVNLETVEVTYRSEGLAGPITVEKSATVALDTGWLVPLQEDPPRQVRVKYQYVLPDGVNERLDAIITLPSSDRTRR